METKESLSHRIREVYLEGEWIAHTNFKRAFSDVVWEQAGTKIGTLNSLADLCFHVSYYAKGFNDYFNGNGFTIKDKYSFKYPGVHGERDWDHLKEELENQAEEFAHHVCNIDEGILDAEFIKPEYGSLRRNIEGIIEHAYYHLGQVSLIKKML